MLRKGTPNSRSIDALATNTHLAPTKNADDAEAKLWTIYLSEAEKFRPIVESWKHDLDGLLIFVSVGRLPLASLRTIDVEP